MKALIEVSFKIAKDTSQTLLKVPEISQVVELEEMGREEGRDEGEPDARPSSGRNHEVAKGNHESGVDQSVEEAEGKEEARVARGKQKEGVARGKEEAGVAGGEPSGKSVRFATQEAEDVKVAENDMNLI